MSNFYQKDRPLWDLYLSLLALGRSLHGGRRVHRHQKYTLKVFAELWTISGLYETSFFFKFSFAWKSAYNLNEMECFRAQAACLLSEAKWRWISIRCSRYNLSSPVVFIKIARKRDVMYGWDLPTSSSVPIILIFGKSTE